MRKRRLREKLAAFAERQEPAVIETPGGLITAMRIFCRDTVVVLIDKYGCQSMLPYEQVLDASVVLPIAEIARRPGWQNATEAADAGRRVVFFPRLSHRA